MGKLIDKRDAWHTFLQAAATLPEPKRQALLVLYSNYRPIDAYAESVRLIATNDPELRPVALELIDIDFKSNVSYPSDTLDARPAVLAYARTREGRA